MSKLKQTFATVTIVSVLIWGALPGGVSALTAAELQVQIDALMAQLSGLQAQLPADTSSTTGAGAPAACSGVTLSRSLTVGSSGTDVKCLQALLNQSADTQVAASGVGSAGSETLYFGNLTRAAVVKFQEKYAADILTPLGLAAGTGFFGSSSRAKATAVIAAGGGAVTTPTTPASGLPAGCASTAGYSPTTGVKCDTVSTTTPTTPTDTTPVVTADTVLASIASDTPAADVHASGTAYNSVLKVNLTAPSSGQVSITGITLKKGGVSLDSTIAGVAAFNSAGNRLTNNFVTFADNKALLTFTNPFVIAAGATTPIWVKANIGATGTAGTYNVSIVAATDIKGATASGTFPITSNAFTMVSGTNTVGGVTLDGVIVHGNGTNDGTAVNINLGTVNQELAKFRFVANANEDVSISKIAMYNNGNTSDVDIQNIDLVGPDGTVLSTVVKPVNRDVVFDLSAAPYKLLKGTTRDLSIRVDVVSGSTRNFRLVIQNDYDVEVKGVATGSGLLITAAGTVDNAFPIGDSSGDADSCSATTTCMNKITVSSGTALFSKANNSPSGNVSAGASSVVLGKWYMTPQGEDMELRTMAYILTYTTALTGTFKIKVNDTTVYTVAGGSTGATGVSTAVTLATYPILAAGVQAAITVEGDINSTTAAGVTYLASLDVTQVKRLSTNDLIDPSITATAANTLTVSTAALAVSKNSSFPNMTIVAGLSDAKVGSFNLNASSTENVSVSSITVGLTNTTNISNLTLKTSDGVQLGSVTTSPSTSNVISITGFSIAKGMTKTVDVFVTTNGSTTGTEVASITAVSATGSSSSTTVTATGLTATGQTATLSSGGTLTLALDTTNTPVAQTLHSNQVDTTLLAVSLAASNAENVKVTTVQVSTTNGVTSLQNLKLIVDGVQKGVTTGLSNGVASFTDDNGLFTVPQDTSVTMYVRGSTTTSGSIASQAVAGLVLDYVEAIGSSGGTKIKPGTTLVTAWSAGNGVTTTGDVTVADTKGFHAGDVIFAYGATPGGQLGIVTAEPTTATTLAIAVRTEMTFGGASTINKIESGATTAASAGTPAKAGVAVTVTSTKDFAVGDAVIVDGASDVELGYVSAIGSATSMTIRTIADVTGVAARVSKIGTATLSTGITAVTALTTNTAPIATTVTSTTGFNVGDFVLIQDTGVAGTFGMVTAIGSTTGISLAVNANVTPGSTSSATLIRVGSANPATVLVTTGATAAARVIAATAATVTDTTGFGAGDVVITAAATAAGTTPTAVNVILGKIGAITSGTVMTIASAAADAALASTRVTRLPGAASSGAALTLHDVEPTITVTSGFAGGASTGQSGQTVGSFSVKADGDRNMSVTSLNVQANGNNLPWNYVTTYNLYNNGVSLLATASPLNATVTADASATALTGTTISLCSAADDEVVTAGEIQMGTSDALTALDAVSNLIAVNDKIVIFVDTTNYITATVTAKSTGADCGGGEANDVTLTVSNSSTTGTAPTSNTATRVKNFNVIFDANSSTPLASQTITAGSTMILTVQADTTSVRTGLGAGVSASYNTKINGTQGSTGGLIWGYTPSGASAISGLTTSDSYPVNGPTFVY